MADPYNVHAQTHCVSAVGCHAGVVLALILGVYINKTRLSVKTKYVKY